MSERLERVTDWAEVRPGGPVFVVKDCPRWNCGKNHRFIVIAEAGPCPAGDGKVRFLPETTCGADEICACAVPLGTLLRVLGGLEEPSTETAAATGTKQHAKENA